MDILNQIIQSMSKEEVRHFKLFTTRTQAEKDRKDLHLFDYIRKAGEAYEEDRIFKKLYRENEKNPFYRLKNRLLSDVNKSLALQHLDDDDVIYIFHLLSLARYFHNRSNHKVALHFIRKAEKNAIQLENYELLDFIYTELIRLSNELANINPEEYIETRKANREKLNALREIEDILAAVVYRLKIFQDISGKVPIFDLLEKTVNEFAGNPAILQNPKLRFTLYQGVSRVLLARRDYVTLEDYLLTTFRQFASEGLFNRNNHDTKLKMLVFLVNTLSKNGKHNLALKYADSLHDAMEEFHGMLYKKYLFFYHNALVFIYNNTDKKKGLALLEDLIRNKTYKDNSFHEFIMLANLAVSNFTLQNYQRTLKNIVQLGIHDGYANASETLKLRMAVFELLVRIETSDFDLVEKRIEKIRREFKELLSQPANATEKELIRIVAMMNKSVDIRSDKQLAREIRGFIEAYKDADIEEFSFVNYTTWLSSKLKP